METLKPLITVQNLVKQYGRFRALNEISFEIDPGEVVGLLGPNGAGKSTTLKILSGLLDANSGVVKIKNENIAHTSCHRQCSFGIMLENNPLPPHLKVGEYLRFRAAIKGVDMKNIRVHTERMMRQVDIQRNFQYQEIGSLSKGMQQRVGLAEALLGDPDLVILDEPTIGLDPNQIIKFRKLIASQKGKRTFIISSHILPEIESLCDRFIIINNGSIVANGMIHELRQRFFKERALIACVECEQTSIDAFRTIHPEIKIRDVFMDLKTNQHQLIIALPTENIEHFLKIIVNEMSWKLLNLAEKSTTLEEIFIQATALHG
ncbi:MAG: ABC transporter ATP-binding protein [Puniceicoccales bacterium]|nr:ABC transporter ATP-binding protein [Puniceicoccales bacterium]